MTVENTRVNVSSRGVTETERLLSNFAPTPFVLDGVEYPCVEAFWQSIKFSPELRDFVARMTGPDAKRASRSVSDVQEIEYGGVKIVVGSPEHYELMRRALRAKFKQNPHALGLLLATGERLITHVVSPDSRTIPGVVFAQILIDLREEFRERLQK